MSENILVWDPMFFRLAILLLYFTDFYIKSYDELNLLLEKQLQVFLYFKKF